MTSKDRRRLKFNPATPIKPKHSIVSSVGNKGFIPTYEKDGSKENMYYLLNMEYKRIWFNELKDFDRVTYATKNSCLADSQIQRRYVQRIFKKKVDPMEVLPPIKIKKFQNIKSKISCHNPNPPRRPDLDKPISPSNLNMGNVKSEKQKSSKPVAANQTNTNITTKPAVEPKKGAMNLIAGATK